MTGAPQEVTSIAEAYGHWAASYDADHNRTRDLDGEVMRQLHESRRVISLVEAGGGTGKNTGFLATLTRELLAFDFSPEMLAVAEAKVRAPHVRYTVHDVREAWPVAAATVDFITFNLVLEHIEDLDAVFGHAAVAVRAGGVVFVSELHPFRQYRGSQARYSGDNGEEVRVQAFLHHASDYIRSAEGHGLRLDRLSEWWHADDDRAWPRLLTLQFIKST